MQSLLLQPQCLQPALFAKRLIRAADIPPLQIAGCGTVPNQNDFFHASKPPTQQPAAADSSHT